MGNGLMQLCPVEHTDYKSPEFTPQNCNKMLVKITVWFAYFPLCDDTGTDNSVSLLSFLPLAHGKRLCIPHSVSLSIYIA